MYSKVTYRTLNLGYTALWFIINCNTYFRMMPFSDIHISQGRVATCLKRGGIFKHEFVANLLPSPPVKKIWKSDNSGEVMAKSLVSCFLTHGVDTDSHPERIQTRTWMHGAFFATAERLVLVLETHRNTDSPALAEYSTMTSSSRDVGVPQSRSVDGPPIIA